MSVCDVCFPTGHESFVRDGHAANEQAARLWSQIPARATHVLGEGAGRICTEIPSSSFFTS